MQQYLIDRKRLKELCTKPSEVADQLGITRKALWNKINKKTEFKETEITKLYEIFGKQIEL